VGRYPALLLSIVLALAPGCGASVAGSDDDLTITTRVKTALLNVREITATRIDVETFKGVVTLSGTVRTAAERDQAVAVTRKVAGVRDVQSALKISPEP
jgi:osmotically-inducible protein OsmY